MIVAHRGWRKGNTGEAREPFFFKGCVLAAARWSSWEGEVNVVVGRLCLKTGGTCYGVLLTPTYGRVLHTRKGAWRYYGDPLGSRVAELVTTATYRATEIAVLSMERSHAPGRSQVHMCYYTREIAG